MRLLARAAFVATIFLDVEIDARAESHAREAADAAFGEARKKATARKRGHGEERFLWFKFDKKNGLKGTQIEKPSKHFAWEMFGVNKYLETDPGRRDSGEIHCRPA